MTIPRRQAIECFLCTVLGFFLGEINGETGAKSIGRWIVCTDMRIQNSLWPPVFFRK